MRELALTAAALVFPCLLILGGVVVALRRQVPPVRFRAVWLFLGLGVAAIILHGISFLFADAWLMGRINHGFYYAFVTAALPEEGFRYLVIRWGLARRPRAGLLTGMLLGSLVGLTFGALEHVGYALDKGWETWLARSFTSVPFHTLSGAVLGYCGAVAIRTRRPWGLAGLAFLVLVHGLADWPLLDPDSDEPLTFLTSGWAGNIASLVMVAVLAAVFARIAWKADAAPAAPVNLWQRLVELWQGAGLTVRPPARADAVRAFESRYGVVLPDDLRAYFLTVDGMEDELDPGTNRFWPLGMVKPVEEELSEQHQDWLAYPGCFVFVDHCIWCFAWAVRLGKEPAAVSGPVFQVTASEVHAQQIAPSFTAFVEMYLADQYSVL